LAYAQWNTSPIKEDPEWLFCLNDLHKAAGGDPKHGPGRLIRLNSTEELGMVLANSQEVEKYTPIHKTPGRYDGTFVCKELVYAHAMWISPSFHLKAIRFFDRGATQGVAVAEDLLRNPLSTLRPSSGKRRSFRRSWL